jgi:E3 ubiquitin-protein ligase BRE1
VFFLQFDEMWNELEEYKEISSNRLNELEKLTSEHQEALKEVEKLKMDVSSK